MQTMIDLSAIEKRAKEAVDANVLAVNRERDYYFLAVTFGTWAHEHAASDIGALIAEVRRLRVAIVGMIQATNDTEMAKALRGIVNPPPAPARGER